MGAAEVLKEIADQVSVCQACGLAPNRKLSVPGEGAPDSEVMFIGEGPGFFENEQGRPFVGQAGKLLDELLAKVSLVRAQVFITNVVKCRPPGNRDPLPEELAACNNYLERQIAAIDPRVIVTLGRFSMAKFLQNVKISDVHGQSCWVKGKLIVPMYHPAAALHQPTLKPALFKDFERLPGYIEEAKAKYGAREPCVPEATAAPQAPAPKKDDTASQPSLF